MRIHRINCAFYFFDLRSTERYLAKKYNRFPRNAINVVIQMTRLYPKQSDKPPIKGLATIDAALNEAKVTPYHPFNSADDMLSTSMDTMYRYKEGITRPVGEDVMYITYWHEVQPQYAFLPRVRGSHLIDRHTRAFTRTVFNAINKTNYA